MERIDQLPGLADRPTSDRWHAARARAARGDVRHRPWRQEATPGRVHTRRPRRDLGADAGAARDLQALSDESLVDRLRGGDAGAGQALVLRYCDPLTRYLRRITDADVAEELHQQTWLSVLDHLDRFDPAFRGTSGNFKAWLFRIATNKAKDHWRSVGRDRAGHEWLSRSGAGEAPAAGESLEHEEQQVRLQTAMEQLSEPQRQILLLRYYGGLKFTAIAELLDIPLNTALTRVHKALAKLRRLMEAE